MRNIFRVGDWIHKKGDGNNRVGKIKEIADIKAYCEFTVREIIIDENQLNGRPIEKNLPVSDNYTYEYEWVSLEELERPKDNND